MAAPQAEWTLLGLAAFRAEVGLSQDQLKDLAGMSRGTIVRIEGGGTAKNSTITTLFDCIYEKYSETFEILDLDVDGHRVYKINFKRKHATSDAGGCDDECISAIGALSLSLIAASSGDGGGFSGQVTKNFIRLVKGYIQMGGHGVSLV